MSETIDELILDVIRKAQEVSIAAENGYGWVCEQDALDDAKDALRARVAALEHELEGMQISRDKYMDLYQKEGRKFADAIDGIVKLKDKIAAFEAENAAMRAEARWIPVGEKLPEKDTWVLVLMSGKSRLAYRAYFADEKFWDCCYPVTHWRKLPPPPGQD